MNYVVKEGAIVIVDEFTGRLMEGRQWSDGLHQAVEAKEGVKVKEETQTLATITLQNFFKLYGKIAGMTGTAMTEAAEFRKIYKLDVIAIPTNRPLRRDEPRRDLPLGTDKFTAIVDEIERMNRWDVVVLKNGEELWGEIVRETGRHAVEIKPQGQQAEGSRMPRSKIDSIERKGGPCWSAPSRSRRASDLSNLLKQRGIKHEVLNAKHHEREAEIVAQAGRSRSRDHRHEHGRSWHRHHAGRQSRNDGLGHACRTSTQRGWTCRATNGTRWCSEIEQLEQMKEDGESWSSSWAACTSSAPSGTRRGASTCSSAAAAAGRATRAAAASSCRWKTT